MTRPTPRRDFLLGKTAASTPGPSESQAAPNAEESILVQVSRRAMACEFEVSLRAQEYSEHGETVLAALDLVEELEEQLSVFRPSSVISRINLTASEGPVEVEPWLFDLLELAMQLYRQTDGAYDISAGRLWEVWGFARRSGTVPTAEQLAEARSRVGGDLVELDAQRKTVRFLLPGVHLNLGSIGKGYAVDRCAERLMSAGISDFLVHGGNSSVRAGGSRTGSSGWTVGIRNPLYLDRRLGEVRLHDQAVGTSGSQFQSFRHQGRRYGHILDPRTGLPAEGVLSATVLAPSATLADGLSTAFYVMGPEAAMAYCREHPEIAALLVCPTSRGVGWEIHQAGLSEGQWSPAS